ncbi:hypothetical protein GQ457_09G023790 [Hibiscus cannabinus]
MPFKSGGLLESSNVKELSEAKDVVAMAVALTTRATDHIVNNDKYFESFSSVENKFVRLPNDAMVKVVSVASKVVSVDTWHARLGHPSRQRMGCFSHMNKEISAVGFSDCDVCHLAKQKRLSFPLSVTKSECIFDLVHMDIWGPFPVESLYGHFYFLTVVDDKSRYLWIFPMKVKSEVRGLIVQFFAFVKTQFSKNIKCLRTDNGKEFDMVEFFKENGVVHQTSCIHTPQQNSVVERKHQHILSVARALRIQAGLPFKFWIDCVMHSAYLINITPTPVLDSRTPFELLFQTVPKVSHLRIFGCLSYASVLPRPETKMHPRSVKCIFLGFPKHSKGYRLFDINRHKVFISRDVVFSENIFPFKVAEKSVCLKEIVLPTCDTNGSLDDLDIGASYLNKDSDIRNSVTESVLHHKSVLQHNSVEQHPVEQQDLSTQVSDCFNAVDPECSFQNSEASAGSTGSFSETHQQQVVSKPLAQRSKSSRVAKLPQKFADFHVSLPKSRSSPHMFLALVCEALHRSAMALGDVDDPNINPPHNAENVANSNLPQATENVSHSGSLTENKLFSTKKINVTLDDQNYLLWHQQVYLTIKTHRLLKFIDSTDQTPSKYITQNGVVCINPEFELFEEQDGALATWLLSTVSQSVLPHLIGLNTASGIWHTLHRLYSSKTTSRLMSYRRLLHSQKKGDLSMQEYLMKIKSLCDNLANSGEKISEHEHIIAILNGLPSEYDSVITVITANPTSSDLAFVSTILLDADVRQSNLLASAHFTSHLPVQNDVAGSSSVAQNVAFEPTSHTTVQTSGYTQNDQSSYSNNNRGMGRGRSSNRPQCQLCGRLGHHVDRCYYRFDMNFKNNEVTRTNSHNIGYNAQSNVSVSPVNTAQSTFPVNVAQSKLSTFPASHLPSSVVYYTSTPVVNPVANFSSRVSQLPAQGFHQMQSLRPSSMVSAPVSHQQSQMVRPMGSDFVVYPSTQAVFPYVQTSASSLPQVHLATSEVLDDNVWFPDSGATHHLTNDLVNLQDGSNLPGSGSVQVGSGHTLSVKYFGQSSLLSSSRKILLKNLLYVPNITKNLLSVSKFTQDNQVSLEFFPTYCQVKDLHSRQVLLQGLESGGLYRLAALSSSVVPLSQANIVSVDVGNNASIDVDKASSSSMSAQSLCKPTVSTSDVHQFCCPNEEEVVGSVKNNKCYDFVPPVPNCGQLNKPVIHNTFSLPSSPPHDLTSVSPTAAILSSASHGSSSSSIPPPTITLPSHVSSSQHNSSSILPTVPMLTSSPSHISSPSHVSPVVSMSPLVSSHGSSSSSIPSPTAMLPSSPLHSSFFSSIPDEKAQYGIMLSERKMKINLQEIEFLGMHLQEGKYHPGPHIAQELIKFPDKDLSKRQILQFLGIINYLRDFVPKISKYINPLRKMLKKDPPQWSAAQSKAVKLLKEILQHLPPLQIPSYGKRIIQADASDKYWRAILFKQNDKKRHLYGYKSGRFSDAEIHYHSTFKEILAVKKAISKFEFHLIGHHFLVEMDTSSFPQMLKFKQKTVTHPQLLRWAEWFSKYSFDCKHIKGKTNVLANLLTRPKLNQSQIMMYMASSSKETVPEKKLKKNLETAFNIPPNLNPKFPPEVYRLVLENKFHSKAKDMIFEYQLNIFKDYGGLMLNPFGLHPDYPFIHPIHFEITEVPHEVKWLLCYLTHIYQSAITRNLIVILKWFFPLSHWKDIIKQAATQSQGYFIIIIFYKPQYFMQHGNAKQLGYFPSAHIHSIQWEGVRKKEDRYKNLQKHMCQINRQIPREIWPPPIEQAPWDTWPEDPALLTPYHKAIMEAQKQYKDNIPDPSEWSQDYPWYESSASKMPKENNNDHMETEEGEDSTSTDKIRRRNALLRLYLRALRILQDQDHMTTEDFNRSQIL